ncbi:hypothetical protein AYM40_20535 [Paraburkholderia phytofirmans OLGA172]|uniref:Uncharacterized protein n=1 Tax=Paraburkholderia phytofirmans OLGA172 TaxID=1417228 RepID=A0A160FQM6_9BURK|nr:hypothetical protein [Paraburkholderia phytofirmans]ANB74846.1 hypothetical protein AYM40_20535 [Paraburkholderia phytofirmans OLGA172]
MTPGAFGEEIKAALMPHADAQRALLQKPLQKRYAPQCANKWALNNGIKTKNFRRIFNSSGVLKNTVVIAQ